MEDETTQEIVSETSPTGQGEGATSSPSPASLPAVPAVKRVRAPRRPLRKKGSPNKRGQAAGAALAPGENPNGIGGREPGTKRSHITPKAKHVRGEMMLAAHVTGKTIKEIAEVFGVSPLTASEGISEAVRGDAFKQARDYMRFRLLPKAMRVLDAALDSGDTEAAKWVAKAIGVEETNDERRAAGDSGGAGEDFESYRLELIRRRRPADGHIAATVEVRPAEGPSTPPRSEGTPPPLEAEVVE